MCYSKWMDERIKRLTCWDMSILKVCVLSFALLVAKLWPAVLSLPWYVYAAVFVVTDIYLLIKIFGKGCCCAKP